jgi:bifunctional DNase/RNase
MCLEGRLALHRARWSWLLPVAVAGMMASTFSASRLQVISRRPQQMLGEAGPPAQCVRVEVVSLIALPDDETSVVVLASKDGSTDKALLLRIEKGDAMAIAARLEDEDSDRATSAGALGPAIRSLGGSVEQAIIESAEPLASEGRLLLRSSAGRTLVLAVPAAESIAVAMESGVPIYARRFLLETSGISQGQLERLERERHAPLDGDGDGRVDPDAEISL